MGTDNCFHRKKRSLQCNICGKTFDVFDHAEDYHIMRRLGYGTKYDGESLCLHLCCDCMEFLIDQCAISPIVDDASDC